ncbi:DUF3788 family protein [Olivibacter sitiensis]|uniref:DUF3788 family protein n=1 Tax=Olivibacter sitiensis TaxID=376470 RepID=UPI00048042DB|nr:DUF3788 family protein [Olivibacter sitiensis]
MKEETPKQLLRNPEHKPDDILFKRVLDKNIFGVMKKINQTFSMADIAFEWKYYKDGKAWLGKATYKKKTLVWISAWENFIKASFYFTEKNRPTVLNLNFDEAIKTSFANREPVGKLIPLTVDIKDEKTLQDFIILLNHKKNL